MARFLLRPHSEANRARDGSRAGRFPYHRAIKEVILPVDRFLEYYVFERVGITVSSNCPDLVLIKIL